jgi:putative membrane protein
MLKAEEFLFRRSTVLGLCLFFFGSAYLMINFEHMVDYGGAASVAIIAYSFPSFIALYRDIGGRKTAYVLLILGLLPVLVEGLAIITGFPYGHFTYSDRMGFLLFDLVPISLAFGYLPILLGSITIASKIESSNRLRFTIIGTIINLMIDLVIDPASVSNGFWSWRNGGLYYGVPIINFVGWLFTGFLYISIFYQLAGDCLPLKSQVTSSLMFILSLWSSFLLLENVLFPGILGFAYLVFLTHEYEI